MNYYLICSPLLFVTRSYVHTFLYYILHVCFLFAKEHATYSVKIDARHTLYSFPSFNTYMRTRVYIYMCVSLCVTRISVPSSDVTSSRTLEERSALSRMRTSDHDSSCISEAWHTAEISHYRRWIEEDDTRFNKPDVLAIIVAHFTKGLNDRSSIHSNEHVHVVFSFFFFFFFF